MLPQNASNLGGIANEVLVDVKGKELAQGKIRAEEVEDMAPQRLLHGLGEEFVERRLVGLQVVEVNSKSFNTTDIKDCLPDRGLHFGDVACIALTREDIDELTGLGLQSGHESLDARCREWLWSIKVSWSVLKPSLCWLIGRLKKGLTAHDSPAVTMLVALGEGQSITNDDIGDPTSSFRLDERAILG